MKERRRREGKTSIRTARAVGGASYMAWHDSRPHVVPAGDFVCSLCGIYVTPATGDNCPGRKPG